MKAIVEKIFKLILALFIYQTAHAQTPTPTPISGIINSYAQVTRITGNSFEVQNITLAPGVSTIEAFGIGQKILIIQMKGARIFTNNDASFGSLQSLNSAGNYEFATITQIERPTGIITITVENLTRRYNDAGSVQLVSVPQYEYATVTGEITATPWDRSLGRGGIVAFEVSQTLSLEADINVSGQGFEGGATNGPQRTSCNNSTTYLSDVTDYSARSNGQNHAQKGESIADYNTNGIVGMEYGRGAILNGGGGGNSHNGGGGGGSNYTSGGNSGLGWLGGGACTGSNEASGIGGYGLEYTAEFNRIFMGGGGGGGQQNNNNASEGANGGGIVIIRANELYVSRAAARGIYANGDNAADTRGNDAAGGGGGGGIILLDINNYNVNNTLLIRTNGGNGGDANTGNPHAGGGGGGVGVMLLTATPPLAVDLSSTPGLGGQDCSTCTNRTGETGETTATPYLVAWEVAGELTNLPIELVNFDVTVKNNNVLIEWTTALEENTDYFEIEKSSNLQDITIVEQIKANGNSNTLLSYQSIDHQPLSGISYYRLKSVDFDGSVDYSEWKSIAYTNQSKLEYEVFPNPTTDFVNFRVNDSQETQHIFIFDQQGSLRHQGKFKNTYRLDVQHMQRGIYIVKISSSEGIKQTKLSIQ